jgi:hypothetical protein
MADHAGLKEHVLELLGDGHAHLSFDRAVADLPMGLRGVRPPGLPHTPWRLVEHLRIAQRDILRFSVDPHHVSPRSRTATGPRGTPRPTPTPGTARSRRSGPTSGP